MVLPAFSRRRLAHLADRMQVIADELIDGFANDGKVDFVTQFAEPMPLLVVAEIMRIPPEETKLFSAWAHDMLAMIAGGLSPQREIECAHSTVKIQRYIKGHLDKRREKADDSAMSDIMAARDDQGNALSEGEIINLMCVFLRAGFETTVQLLGNTVHAVLSNPEQWAAVSADPSLIPAAIEEVMRAESPVQRLLRHVTRDTRIGDVDVPQGARLFLLVGAANRDPSIFECPASFDITRQARKKHLGFGQGLHFCMGASIARDEARITLETLIRRLDNLRLAPGANDFRYKDNPIARGLRHLHLEFDVRPMASASTAGHGRVSDAG
jgi:cytochrome P450